MKCMFAILLFPLIAQADPGPATQYLMNEPATVFDVGMIRLDNLTNWTRDHVGFTWTVDGQPELFRKDINSGYSAEDDRIYVSISASSDSATEAQMQEGCQMALNQMRFILNKSLPDLFQHAGQHKSPDSRKYDQEIRALFELRCYVSGRHSSAEGRWWASQTLNAEEMTIGRWQLTN